ncbi:major facilitator superfamily protein, putative [Ichthyophthirius multifiliis]|uniref:Major facilitator superfamily protein, putative n=1 Tax=Ichthyophthirius multifiliis TaxID=5932 RepID=G0QT36_ICHMU|nr:major facilitator superfamily protein, putative [Ichthyophthirius multifiliis]EGR31611.1 major facilitator superfamily protein, putative [Ichthyophthirius multifiliis]|eukprot:XP_004035097.1 major facilitator superfamily protein, putative [Ichthyophthirius multifiliis]
MSSPIMFRQPIFECIEQNGLYKICTEDQVCQLQANNLRNEYRVISDDSISSEFELYCDKKPIIGFAQAALFAGQALSGSTCALIIGLCPDLYALMAMFFGAGLGITGYETVILVYCTEISERRFRNICINVLVIMWALAQVFYPIINSFIVQWRYIFVFAIGLPLFCSVGLSYLYFCESPRYLVSKKKYYEARQVFRHISEVNNRPAFQFHFFEEIDDYNEVATRVYKKGESITKKELIRVKTKERLDINLGRQTNIFDLFKTKQLAIKTLIMCYCWFVRYFVYYCILFSLERLGTQLNQNFLLLAIIEVIASLLTIPMKMKMKRKNALRSAFYMMSIVSLLLFIVRIPQNCQLYFEQCLEEKLTLILAILLKFSIVFFAVNLMTYTPELFPTVLRSQAYGLCMIFGQLGSILAPIYISQYIFIFEQMNPLTSIAFLGILGVFLTIKLYENENMEDYLENKNDTEKPLLNEFKEIQMIIFTQQQQQE